MKLGWVDFSKEERNKTLEVLRLLAEPGAVDEIGIGIVRDAFADAFFPGTSTLLTRAKYFLVVPYIVHEAVSDGCREDVQRWIDEEERKVAVRLYERHKEDPESGIIGQLAIKHGGWVKRAPSELYWSGIRRFGICGEKDLSFAQYVNTALAVNRAKGRGLGRVAADAEDEHDDVDASGWMRLKSLDIARVYRKGWRGDVDITLTREEAEYLKAKIETNTAGTVMASALQSNLRLSEYKGDFNAFSIDMVNRGLAGANEKLLLCAQRFSSLVRAARVRYNVKLQGDRSDVARRKWEEIDLGRFSDTQDLVEEVFSSLEIKESSGSSSLYDFLKSLSAAFAKRDVGEIDRCVVSREVCIKGRARAKLLHAEKYSPDNWIGGEFLDYRLGVVGRLFDDIYDGLEATNV